MADEMDFTGCVYPDCGVRVPIPTDSADALCFDHRGLLARRVNEAEGPNRDAAVADYRRRVMGLDC